MVTPPCSMAWHRSASSSSRPVKSAGGGGQLVEGGRGSGGGLLDDLDADLVAVELVPCDQVMPHVQVEPGQEPASEFVGGLRAMGVPRLVLGLDPEQLLDGVRPGIRVNYGVVGGT